MSVKFDQHVDVNAAPDATWAILSDSTRWPLWFSEIDSISDMPSGAGASTFSFVNDGQSGTGTIAAINTETMTVRLVLQVGDARGTHTFDIDRSGGFLGIGSNDSRLRYTKEYDVPGGVLGDFVAGGNPKDMTQVKHTLEKFKKLAEMR